MHLQNFFIGLFYIGFLPHSGCRESPNTGVQTLTQDPGFSPFGCTPRSGILGSYANSTRKFLAKPQPPSTVTDRLAATQQRAGAPGCPCPGPHVSLSVFFKSNRYPVGVKCCLIVVLISGFPVISDTEHLFTCS